MSLPAPELGDHFRTVRLRIVFWIVLWITGLKLWVICLTTFDFWLSHDQHEHNPERELLVRLSLHCLVNGAASVTVFFQSANWLGARPYCQVLARKLSVLQVVIKPGTPRNKTNRKNKKYNIPFSWYALLTSSVVKKQRNKQNSDMSEF